MKVNREFRGHTISLSKPVISVNLPALNIIERVLLLPPTTHTALLLKRQLGIPAMTDREIYVDLINPNSVIRKYLAAMMLSLIARCEMLLDENFRRMLIALKQAEALELEEMLAEEEIKSFLKLPQTSTLREQLITLDDLAINTLAKGPLHINSPTLPVWEYLLEASRYNRLSFYLSKSTKVSSLPIILEIVEQEFRMLRSSFERIDELRKQANLGMEDTSQLNEIEERLARRVELDTPEMIEKMLPTMSFEDEVVLTQHAARSNMNVAVIGIHALQVFEKKQSKDTSMDTTLERNKPATIRVIGSDKFLLSGNEIRQIQYFQDQINDQISYILDKNKDVITYTGEALLELTDQIHKVTRSKHFTNHHLSEAKLIAAKFTNGLYRVDNVDYMNIIKIVSEWCNYQFIQQTNHYQENLHPFKINNTNATQSNTVLYVEPTELSHKVKLSEKLEFNFTESMNFFKTTIEIIIPNVDNENLRNKLIEMQHQIAVENCFNQDEANKLTKTYQEIEKNFPNFEQLSLICSALIKLPFIDEKNLKSFEVDLDQGFEFN